MSVRCTQCDERISGPPYVTSTGRQLCTRCASEFQGSAAAMVAGQSVGGAVATAGWFERIRRRRSRS